MSFDWDAIATQAASARKGKTSYPGARGPTRFRENVLAQLVRPENVAYLEGKVRGARKAAGLPQDIAVSQVAGSVREFAEGAAKDSVASDPLALRGRDAGAGFWPEVRRLNAIYLSDIAPGLGGGLRPAGGDVGDDGYAGSEDLSRRIFEKTILRPPGREHLNGPGPLWEQREYQQTWGSTDGGAAGRRGATPAEARESYAWMRPDNPYGVPPTARGHSDARLRGATLLTPSYEESGVAPGTYDIADPDSDPGDRLFGAISAWGDRWHRSGSEFDRWRGIPVWQKGGRRLYDEDAVEETLGLGDREHGGIFRRFDMSRMHAESLYRPGGPMVSARAPAGPDARPGAPALPISARETPIGTVPPDSYRGVRPLAPVATGAELGFTL
jgi:hypothetical protein